MNEDALSKALNAASEAADDSRQLELVKAVLTAQAISQAMQPQQQCQHQVPQQFDARKWLVIGGVAVSLGLVGALFAVAVAIGGVCATVCLLVLRGLWADFKKGN